MFFLQYDTATLQTALLVNKAWYAEAIRVLWKKPPIAALSALASSSISYDRRQFYADHVRELSFNAAKGGSAGSNFYDVHFRRLRCIRIKGSCFPRHIPIGSEDLHIGQYLQPSVEEIDITDVDFELCEYIFYLLEIRCPRLRILKMMCFSLEFPSTRLLKFLHTCKSLKKIDLVVTPFSARDPFVIDDRLLMCLIHYNGLQYLFLSVCVSFEMLDRVFKRTERSQPFRDTRCIAITLESRALPLLVTHVKSIPWLILMVTIQGSRISPFSYVGSLGNIGCLAFRFREGGEWPSNDFSMIKYLKNMLVLQINSSKNDISFPELTDEEFGSAFENMNLLAGVTFNVHSNLSTTAIISVAVNCPNIRYFDMFGSFDLHNLQSIAKPLFPTLWKLTLTRLIEPEPGSRYQSVFS